MGRKILGFLILFVSFTIAISMTDEIMNAYLNTLKDPFKLVDQPGSTVTPSLVFLRLGFVGQTVT